MLKNVIIFIFSIVIILYIIEFYLWVTKRPKKKKTKHKEWVNPHIRNGVNVKGYWRNKR